MFLVNTIWSLIPIEIQNAETLQLFRESMLCKIYIPLFYITYLFLFLPCFIIVVDFNWPYMLILYIYVVSFVCCQRYIYYK